MCIDAAATSLAVWECIARLREESRSESLMVAIPSELCRSLGFSRAALLRADAGRLTLISGVDSTIESTSAPADLAFPARPPETEFLRRRDLRGLGVDAVARWAERLRSAGPPEALSGPLTLDGRVAGLLRVDRHGQSDPLDAVDLVALWTVAEAAGTLMEAVLLRERMQTGRNAVLDVAATTDALFDEVAPALFDLTTGAGGAGTATALAADRLTARESQVLSLIAGGETNAGIARRLLISESTVKTHVKHILRKLGASHRAEAVSRFLAH